jgi:2-polyprenyl-3-methyl-5-hydroxy-6-metoxy-1,4-benzoquinol methylase
MNILDIGCGSGQMLELLYRNRYKANLYLGIDIRTATINSCKEKWKDIQWAQFDAQDMVQDIVAHVPEGKSWNYITCFEVFEHIKHKNGPSLLKNIKKNMSKDTVLLVSTPCFDPVVGAANNHIIDGEIGEYTYKQFKDLLETELKIVDHFGTFCSKKDIKEHIPAELKPFYDRLNMYYDSNLMSNIFAPLFPQHSRNVIWECTL